MVLSYTYTLKSLSPVQTSPTNLRIVHPIAHWMSLPAWYVSTSTQHDPKWTNHAEQPKRPSFIFRAELYPLTSRWSQRGSGKGMLRKQLDGSVSASVLFSVVGECVSVEGRVVTWICHLTSLSFSLLFTNPLLYRIMWRTKCLISVGVQ